MNTNQAKTRKAATIGTTICTTDGCYVALVNDETQIANHARWHEMRRAHKAVSA